MKPHPSPLPKEREEERKHYDKLNEYWLNDSIEVKCFWVIVKQSLIVVK